MSPSPRQEALDFLRAVAGGGVAVAALPDAPDYRALAALAGGCGYETNGDAIAEAFRLTMRVRQIRGAAGSGREEGLLHGGAERLSGRTTERPGVLPGDGGAG